MTDSELTRTMTPLFASPVSLDTFRRHGDDMIDRWDGRRFTRAVDAGDGVEAVQIDVGSEPGPTTWTVTAGGYPSDIEDVVHRQFIVGDAPGEGWVDTCPEVTGKAPREIIDSAAVVRSTSLFQSVLRCVTAQQVNLEFASVLRQRLATRLGIYHSVRDTGAYWLDIDRALSTSVDELRDMQLSGMKARCILATARAIADGVLDSQALAVLDDVELRSRLTSIPGIGRWTADWVMIRWFDRPLIAAGDLGVRKAVRWLHDLPEMPSERTVRELTGHWGEHAAVIQAAVMEAFNRHNARG
ncbi:DNA-3-methyladenine glycosylase family protein [Corynebacterium glyciniphilum]|uniref:DNA-3-methyladenine glycosylase family protein n=1 Tax=Corynebacterium glyciniphilum TaxID=1404244 RepID=UPI003FD50F58